MCNLCKLPLFLLFATNICMCVSLYLEDKKHLVTTHQVDLTPDVSSERTYLRFKKHNIKLGACPKGMTWYYGRCRPKKRKEDNYYDYEFPVYYDAIPRTKPTNIITETISTETTVASTSSVAFKASTEANTPTVKYQASTESSIVDNKKQHQTNKTKTTNSAVDFQNNSDSLTTFTICFIFLMLFAVLNCARVCLMSN